ncbi:MAG: PAS domain S-box protein, partial [Methanomassiliicoccales archaeon]|nr:PAS domain S-box protein [Methanomassiliicoccales archaeon]
MAYDLETMIAFFEMSPDGLVITDEQGRASQLNPSFERILGHSRDDILGSHIWDIMSMALPEDEKARLAPTLGREALLEHLRGGPDAKDNLLITARAHRHDGRRIWIEVYRMVLETGGQRRLAF